MPPFSTTHRRRGRADRQLPAGRRRRAARGRDARAAASGAATRRATRSRTSPTCARRSPPTRRACRSCARWSRSSASTWCSAYMRHVQDNAEESVRRVIAALQGRRASTLPLDNGARIGWRSRSTPSARSADDRLHRHLARSCRTTSTRPKAVVHGGGAVRLPHAGRRRHPAQRRLPEAAAGDRPRGLDAEPAPAGRGGRRQRRDLDRASPTRCTARWA